MYSKAPVYKSAKFRPVPATHLRCICCQTSFLSLTDKATDSVTDKKTLFHDLLLRSYFYHCFWGVITAHNLTPEKRDNNYAPPYNPHFVPPKQHSTYNWHLALLWVSVMHTLTQSSITVNKVSATF